MSSFTYPGKDRWKARLRRFTGAGLIALALMVLADLLRPRIGDKAFDALLSLTPLTKEQFNNITSDTLLGLIVLLALAWTLSKWTFVEVLEFHLFPWFDDETLRPITSKTGLLSWLDMDDCPIHQTSTDLRAWIDDEIHDGRWSIDWLFRGRPALKEKAFSYALLLGPNGVGKSQLAREIAREKLGSPRTAEDQNLAGKTPQLKSPLKMRLARWRRRINPWEGRQHSDPWEIGEIVPMGDWEEPLRNWRPSAPTVLILDDPHGILARDVIDKLEKSCGQFWYSVKLIIIDQFVPARLELDAVGAGYRDQIGRKVPVFAVSDIKWDGTQARRVLARGVWGKDQTNGEIRFDAALDVSEFWDSKKLGRLCGALDGNPLMLAEAALWLTSRNARGRPFRTIAALLEVSTPEEFEDELFSGRSGENYRSQIAHRILRERVDELFNGQLAWAQDANLDKAEFFEALCCAALAGGIPLQAFPNLNRIEATRLAKLLPIAQRGELLLPAIGSWPICEAFVNRALSEFHTLDLAALVKRALASNPSGVARNLARSGPLAHRMIEIVAALERNAEDPVLTRDLFVAAATRALWSTRDAVPIALQLLERQSTANLRDILARIERLGAHTGRTPDCLVAVLLLAAAAARYFTGNDWDWDEWRQFEPLWFRWLRRPGRDFSCAPPFLQDALVRECWKFYDALFQHTRLLNDIDLQFALMSDLLFGQSPGTLMQRAPAALPSATRGWWTTWLILSKLHGTCADDEAIAKGREIVCAQAEVLRAKVVQHLPVEATPKQRAFVEAWSLICLLRAISPSAVEPNRDKIKVIAQEFADDIRFVRVLLYTEALASGRLHEDRATPELMIRNALAAESLCQRFSADTECAANVTWCWRYAILERSTETHDIDSVRNILEHMQAWQSRFESDFGVNAATITAYQSVLEHMINVPNPPALIGDIFSLVEQIADRHSDFSDIQWGRAKAWADRCDKSKLDAQKGMEIDAVARKIDGIAAPFPDHPGVQLSRLRTWAAKAGYESRFGTALGEPQQLAERIEHAARRFPNQSNFPEVVVFGWESAAWAWARDPREWRRCENAARRADTIARDWSGSQDAKVGAAAAWMNVIKTHWQRRDYGKLDGEALEKIEAISTLLPENESIGDDAAYAWACVAKARTMHGASRPRIEEAVSRVRQIAARFPENETIRKNLTFALHQLDGGDSVDLETPAKSIPSAARPEPRE